jgi:hypothetical protein
LITTPRATHYRAERLNKGTIKSRFFSNSLQTFHTGIKEKSPVIQRMHFSQQAPGGSQGIKKHQRRHPQGLCALCLSPSVENPSGGASVAYLFYSSSLRYFENILVQAFDEGRDSLQPLCLGIFSNGFVFEETQFDWRPASLPATFTAHSSYFASAISQSLPATNSVVSTPMMCRQINGASLVMSSAMPPKPQATGG